MTEAQFGLLTSVFLIVYAVLSPFAGFLADRFNRSHVIILSVFVWSVVTLLTAYAKTYEQLLFTRALMGISEAACMPASAALIVDYHRGATRSLASGLLLSGAMTGGALGGIGGTMAESHGWAHAYVVFGAIGIGFAVVLLLLLRDPRSGEETYSTEHKTVPPRLGEALAHLFTNRGYLVMLSYGCLGGVAAWSVVGWMPTYIKEKFELTQGSAGLSTTAYLNIAALVGMLVGGFWADRWSRTNERARILVPVIGLAIAAPAVFLIAQTTLLPVALGGLALYGLSRHFVDANSMPIYCLFVEPRYRATSWGIATFVACVIGGIGIYAGGVLRDAHVDVGRIFQFGAACLAVGGLLLASLLRLPALRAATAASPDLVETPRPPIEQATRSPKNG